MLLQRISLTLFVVYAALSTSLGQSGTFSVAPIRIDLSASIPTAAITLENHGEIASVVQLDVVKWSMRDGVDVYEPDQALLATPPIFTMPPGKTQVIRVGLR